MRNPWRVDDMIIHKIVEEEKAYNTFDKFFPGLDPAILKENLSWYSKDGFQAETGGIFLSYHSFVIQTPHHNVLIDSCVGNNKSLAFRDTWHNRTDRRWFDEFAATGLKPDDIDYVFCSHLHVDHVGWNTRLVNGKWVPTFPNARYLMVDKEFEFTRDFAKLNADIASRAKEVRIFESVFAESVAPVVEAGQADFVSATHVLNEHIRLLYTPGHTPGHVAVSAGRGWDGAVFTGDLIHTPIQARYPDIKMFVDEDPELAADTRRNFLERFVDTETLVCTMHFPDPSVGHLRRWGEGYRLEYVAPSGRG